MTHGEAYKRIVESARKAAKEKIASIKKLTGVDPTRTTRYGCLNADRTRVEFPDGSSAPVVVIGNPLQCGPVRRIGPNRYLAVGPRAQFIQVDDNKQGYLLIVSDDYTKLYVRRLKEETLYEVEDLPPIGFNGSSFHVGAVFPYNNGPKFTPSGKHIFMVVFPLETDPPGTIKYRLIKNWRLVTKDNGDKVVEGEIIDKSYQITFDNVIDNLPLCPAPSEPTITLEELTTEYTSETISTSVYEPEGDTNINTVFNSDTTQFDVGVISELDQNLGAGWDESRLGNLTQLDCIFAATEDRSGNVVIDYWCQYWVHRANYKNFRLVEYTSPNPNYSGFMPYIIDDNGFFPAPYPKLFALNAPEAWNGDTTDPPYDDENLPFGWGNNTWSDNTPPADQQTRSLRYIYNKQIHTSPPNFTGTLGTITPPIGSIRYSITTFFPAILTTYYRILGAASMRCFNVNQIYQPDVGDPGLPFRCKLTFPSTVWGSYERLYLWVKGSSSFTAGELYVRLNDSVDIPVIDAVPASAEWRLLEVDISSYGPLTVSSITLVYDDGSGPISTTGLGNPVYATKIIGLDMAISLAKDLGVSPAYSSSEFVPPTYENNLLGRTLRRKVTWGNNSMYDGGAGKLRTGNAFNVNEDPIYPGHGFGQAGYNFNTLDSNASGFSPIYSISFCNQTHGWGICRISNLQDENPQISGEYRSTVPATGFSAAEDSDTLGLNYLPIVFADSDPQPDLDENAIDFYTSRDLEGAYNSYDYTTNYWVSPWDSTNREANAEYFSALTDKIFYPGIEDTGYSKLVKAVDSYIWLAAENVTVDDETYGELTRWVYNPDTEELSSSTIRGLEITELDAYTLRDFTIK